MLEKDGDTFAAVCDFCPYGDDIETDNFYEAIKIMKENGWKIYRGTNGLFVHKCPGCVEEGK